MKTLFAKTYGASRVCFTHAPSCVLAASGVRRAGAAPEHDVRYHSFHDNTYLRFFKARYHYEGTINAAAAPAERGMRTNPSAGRCSRLVCAFRRPRRDLFPL